ncbi:MAG: aminotransferase class IV [Planctomycetota bacterium]
MGCYTTMLLKDGAIGWWEDHWRRIARGAATLGLPAPDRDEIEAALLETCAESMAECTEPAAEMRVRLFWDSNGAKVDVAPYQRPTGPLRLRPLREPAARSRDNVKRIDRAGYDRARGHAPDWDDALLLDERGFYLESTVANVFFRIGDDLITRPPGDPILAGITRDHVLAAAESLGWRLQERPVGPADAAQANACFVTNALLLAHPVSEIEGTARFRSEETAKTVRESLPSTGPPLYIIKR